MSAFPLPLVFAAWGFRNGAAAWQSPGELANYCISAGIFTVAVQLGRDHTGQYATNPEDARALRSRGLRVAVWGVEDAADVIIELGRLEASTDDWLPQIEGSDQRDLVLDAVAHGVYPSAVVTNYGGAGDTPGEADELRRAGVRTVFVECYNDQGVIEPYINLNRMLGQGEVYGWRPDELVATLGTYHGELPDVYIGEEGIGRTFGIYLAEPMMPDQWAAYAELNTDAPIPPTPEDDDMDPVTDTQARDGVKTMAQAAISVYADPKPRGRNTVAWRVANADDTSWNAARDGVVAALDAAGVPPAP